MNSAKTMYEKIWDTHIVASHNAEAILYIDLHLIHEVTSPQAFEGLRDKGRSIRRPNLTIATMDHSIPTTSASLEDCSPENKAQLTMLEYNCQQADVTLFPLGHPKQGIVHVIAPEQGLILPGMTVVCGDSHTSTHGAFGALAFGIGTSQVEHVLATQSIRLLKSKTLKITYTGKRGTFISAKDVILYTLGIIGNNGATGYVIEYSGEIIEQMSMEERLTMCNMSIEAGAKSSLIAPDCKTFAYIRKALPLISDRDWEQKIAQWSLLKSDSNAVFDRHISIDISGVTPQVTWGTNPSQVIGVDGYVPDPSVNQTNEKIKEAKDALNYMNLSIDSKLDRTTVDHVFIGSCTNSRIEDLREAAKIASLGKVVSSVKAIVVPGSVAVREQAEKEGLKEIFESAGFQWRHPGCSMCLGMNDDALKPGNRCASTSNRNFEGRQGRGARTHLMSPAMAAAAAITGKITDVRLLVEENT
ncbi:3-isopropylmalate dehydratase large subunit [Aliiglaciecola sp. LCG003]|uniref:3-isopropylmalate dehydratase large subunit n=1 Tax=Aliiglaciecola sp. LCG003 TaxID=3053655 RepID=UPI0025746090|nr:3-isopropylmalate dehydratase large subunit [Aliiglaciecola sp. LCG003]WJG08172.1 3-isopropylmalate dehydratase large subunit [Aliiglaciecola sp. LCG003]